jgi:hypothetical protein
MSENRDSCDMVKRDSADAVVAGEPGGFFIEQRDEGEWWISLRLPDGSYNDLPIKLGPDTGRGWVWDGNQDKPTLFPSVHCIGNWHGWIRGGRMESC